MQQYVLPLSVHATGLPAFTDAQSAPCPAGAGASLECTSFLSFPVDDAAAGLLRPVIPRCQ
eukprot:362009-Chlamydomonas_euryale.AAC.9